MVMRIRRVQRRTDVFFFSPFGERGGTSKSRSVRGGFFFEVADVLFRERLGQREACIWLSRPFGGVGLVLASRFH